MACGSTDAIVTTDCFAFDDSTDYYKLQGLGRVCEMGDAMVGSALRGHSRSLLARDPQCLRPTNTQP